MSDWAAALAKAQETRLRRAEIRHRLEQVRPRDAALRACARLVADPPPALSSMLVSDLIAWCHRTKAASAEKLLRSLEIPPSRKVGARGVASLGALTDRERALLAGALRKGHIVARKAAA